MDISDFLGTPNTCTSTKSTKFNMVETGKLQYIILWPRIFSLLGQLIFLTQIKYPILLIKVTTIHKVTTIFYEEK